MKDQQKADKLAIDFAEWCAKYGITDYGDKWVSGALWSWGHQKAYTLEELLDKFKEETNWEEQKNYSKN